LRSTAGTAGGARSIGCLAADSCFSRPPFGSVSRGGPIEQRQLQPVDFQKASANNPLAAASELGIRY